jgi:hypothetical protein
MTDTRVKDINAALVTAYQDVNLGLRTAYEVRDFRPPADGTYAAVYNLYGDAGPATMGETGEDNYAGIFQVSIYVPENSGTGQLHTHADSLLSYFKAGRSFIYNGQEVKVRRSSPSPIRKDPESASYIISVSIRWDARSQR